MKNIISCVIGSSGKMGQALIAVLKKDKDFGKIIKISNQHRGNCSTIFDLKPQGIGVVFDFTSPSCTLRTAQYCAENKLPLVTGTTGLNQTNMKALIKYAKMTPILWSPNMSLAVNFIEMMLPLLGQILPADTDIEIVEHHHRDKKDSPSGTAMFFASCLAEALDKKIICGRPEGDLNIRDSHDIFIHSLRGGAAAGGKNEVLFLADQEEISICHRALSNNVYAKGSIQAAKWLIDKKTGFYSMKDLIPDYAKSFFTGGKNE